MVRWASCNEMFEGWDIASQFGCLASLGYQGVEIAPFTMAARASEIPSARRREVRTEAARLGLTVTGLHWLLAGPAAEIEGWHLTDPDPGVRAKTVAYIGELASLCADLGGGVLVLGSPRQRSTTGGLSVVESTKLLVSSLRAALPAVAAAGVTLCLEPLPAAETDVINSCNESLAVIRELDHPNLRLVLDVKSLAAESRVSGESIPDIVRRVGRSVEYVQANDENRGRPGSGLVDFVPIMAALKAIDYDGWISIEPFDFRPGPETIARESIAYLKESWATAEASEGAVHGTA